MKLYTRFIKIKYLLLVLILVPFNISADTVRFSQCVDGDTAKFISNKKEITVRFLGIDTPELDKDEDYSTEAANYTCRKLKRAKKIKLEYEKKKYDKYDRVLAYVFVDDKMLEELLIKNGYAKVRYIDKKYKYYDRLKEVEAKAIVSKKGVFNDEKEEENIFLYIKKYLNKIFSNILREF